MTRYLSCADTAKFIRAQLKAKFKGVKFSVRSSVYSGGASINVDWTDGPTASMVDAVVKPFAGGGFDGSIDMQYSNTSYLLPDGSAMLAQTSGTEGSMGYVAKQDNAKPCEEAERVSFGATFIFTKRNVSRKLAVSALMAFERKWGADEAEKLEIVDQIFGGGVYVSTSDFDTQRRYYEILERRMIAA